VLCDEVACDRDERVFTVTLNRGHILALRYESVHARDVASGVWAIMIMLLK
jgi:hypothetical protein